MELQEDIFTQVVSLVNKGKLNFKKNDFAKAIEYYQQAKAIFPDSVEECRGSEQLYILLGDAYFANKEYEKSQAYYISSQNCLDKDQWIISKFKIGKILFEKGDINLAKTYFKQVYEHSGKELFYSEDAKYYNLIHSDNQDINKKEKQITVYKSFKGKNYTKEEWDIFEQRQWEEYLIKNNKRPKYSNNSKNKDGGFFLDEKIADDY